MNSPFTPRDIIGGEEGEDRVDRQSIQCDKQSKEDRSIFKGRRVETQHYATRGVYIPPMLTSGLAPEVCDDWDAALFEAAYNMPVSEFDARLARVQESLDEIKGLLGAQAEINKQVASLMRTIYGDGEHKGTRERIQSLEDSRGWYDKIFGTFLVATITALVGIVFTWWYKR